MPNKIAFLIQTIFIGLFLLIFSKKKNEQFLQNCFFILFIIVNLFSNYEINIAHLFTTTIEPLSVGMYFLGIILYNFDNKNQLIRMLYKVNLFAIALFLTIFFYDCPNIYFNELVKNLLLNCSISLLSFSISYWLERKIFDYLLAKKFKIIASQGISVIVSQFFDTAFYTLFIFYNKPLSVIQSIFIISFTLKAICIFSYVFFLKFQKTMNV